MITALSIIVGFALDLVIGDPRRIPHPVVAMGKAIDALEGALRRAFPNTPAGERGAGIVIAIVMPVGAFALTWALIAALTWVHPVLGFAAQCWLACQILATCELGRQSMLVARALAAGSIDDARRAVARIVGRDTESLDAAGVTRAAVETVAENASDGVIAPLFYLAIGGAPLGMAYKAVNTMDSMIGYKNDRYLDFGRAAAKLDDVVNFVPSRLAALVMIASCPAAGLSASGAWRIWRRDRANHASPNSAQTEAVMAGALGVRLAGDASYFGKIVHKPTIGDDERPIEVRDIARANRLVKIAATASCVLFVAVRIGAVAALSACTGYAGLSLAGLGGGFFGGAFGGIV